MIARPLFKESSDAQRRSNANRLKGNSSLIIIKRYTHNTMARYQQPIWGIGADLNQLNFIYRELQVDQKDISYLTENVLPFPPFPIFTPPSLSRPRAALVSSLTWIDQ